MINVEPYREFLTSLSRVSRMRFEIRDGNELLLSSTPGKPDTTMNGELEKLTAFIENGSELYVSSPSAGDRIFGVPVRNGDGTAVSLIAYGAPLGEIYETTDITGKSADDNIGEFVVHLGSLIEDSGKTQDEIEEMAEELSRSFEDLYLYSRIGTAIKTLRFSGEMLKQLVEDLLENMKSDLGFARLPNRREENVIVSKNGYQNLGQEFIDGLISLIPREAVSLKEENYFIVNDSGTIHGYEELHEHPYRFLAVQIQDSTEWYGWLGLVSFNLDDIFQRSELRLLGSIAEQMAIVISNTRLYKRLERSVINVVRSLISAIEAKDIYTRGHSERVDLYSMDMAEKLGMEEKEKKRLHWASMLHDVGKIGIPESILNKPDRLTDEEYDLIKGHPQKGYEILKSIEQLSDSLPGILHHHEKYDGNGYPGGLKGEEIPFHARIIAIADTFDAITSSRAYRTAQAGEKAMKIINEVAGSQLDPGLVTLFRGIVENGQLSGKEDIQEGCSGG